eukprot:sb/3473074/
MAVSYLESDTPEVVLRSLFTKYDPDGSGSLSPLEAKTFLCSDLGFQEEEAEACLLLHDNDGSGTLSLEEFISWAREGDKFNSVTDETVYYKVHAAVEMFKSYDKDGRGSLDVGEFSSVLGDLGYDPDTAESAVKALDGDGNGVVSFPEFLKWLNWV